MKQQRVHLDERVLQLAMRLVGGNYGTVQPPHLPAAAYGTLAFRDLIADPSWSFVIGSVSIRTE